MDIDKYVNIPGLAAAAGMSEVYLRGRLNALVNPPKYVPPVIEPKTIGQMSVNARKVFLQSAAGRVWSVEGFEFDRICAHEDAYVCFSSKLIKVARTDCVKTEDLPVCITAAVKAAGAGSPLDTSIFRKIPRSSALLSRESYKRFGVLASGQPEEIAYPGQPKAWWADAKQWKLWSQILKISSGSWMANTVVVDQNAYWVLSKGELMTVQRLFV